MTERLRLARNIELPVACFLNGEPLRNQTGDVITEIIGGEIRDHVVVGGLTLADAKLLVALANSGKLR